jgi:hypothetical protein
MGSHLIETGRPHTCNISTEESYPSTEPKLGDWRGAPSRSSYWVTRRSSTTAAPQASSNDAYPSPKVRSYCKKYTRGLAVTTQYLDPSLETPSDKVSTGQPRWLTPLGLYAPAKGFTHLLVATNKFSKWIEVRPLNSIRSEQAVAFFTNIIHRFGVPNSIITDNGTQFLTGNSWTSARTTTSVWTGPP